jgi:hypothetical protein
MASSRESNVIPGDGSFEGSWMGVDMQMLLVARNGFV